MGKVAAHLYKTVAIILKCDANLYRQIVQLAGQNLLVWFYESACDNGQSNNGPEVNDSFNHLASLLPNFMDSFKWVY